jgi:hypothetical protein
MTILIVVCVLVAMAVGWLVMPQQLEDCPCCDRGIVTIRVSNDPTSRVIAKEPCWVCSGTGQWPGRKS